jgi:hypothetical protein
LNFFIILGRSEIFHLWFNVHKVAYWNYYRRIFLQKIKFLDKFRAIISLSNKILVWDSFCIKNVIKIIHVLDWFPTSCVYYISSHCDLLFVKCDTLLSMEWPAATVRVSMIVLYTFCQQELDMKLVWINYVTPVCMLMWSNGKFIWGLPLPRSFSPWIHNENDKQTAEYIFCPIIIKWQ